MNLETSYPILELFLTKAKKLEDSSFLESITDEFRLGLHMEIGKPMEVTSIRPHQESTDAFVLTFRFFVQKNEAISILKLQNIFDSSIVSKQQQKSFNSIRSELNSFLDESAHITYKENKLTNRVIMDTVLYGELSHANTEKKQQYDLWMDTNQLFQEAIWHRFIISVIMVLTAVQNIAVIIREILSSKNA